MASDAVLFGAVGGPQYDELAFELKPERGLLALRKEMDLFANLRPAIVFDALVDASTLKPDVVSGLNIMILRELCGGSYFAEPRGIDDQPNGQKRAMIRMLIPHEKLNGLVAWHLIWPVSVMAGHIC